MSHPIGRPTNGRPEPEVIVQFQDGGHYYSKGRLEKALVAVISEAPKPSHKEVYKCKKEDVDTIVNEFEIPRVKAEKLLTKHDGDLQKALRALINRTE
ncbi:hypothetical protein FRB94_000247 [Tulasnella sp. JGI-2019a]|nr:hypothetical protein FRB94_000247 [Tulasnella sp. JGI-2019a]KAG9015299.1 hypothetical protein FRB93_012998 [Tulasnella sp. JGI-2019a]KAG9039399.1 hypothetical protein FRB95_010688 [Tulasnella sp. JGI-2019a]